MLPALVSAQRDQRPLIYRGWAIGISLDSATELTKVQFGQPLQCAGMDTQTMSCQTDHGPGHVSLYFSPIPRRLEEMNIMKPLDLRASRDSLEKWFTARWGRPLPRTTPATAQEGPQSAIISDIVGRWARGGFVFGMVAIAGLDTTQMLSIAISSPARRIRLMRERSDTMRNRQ